MPEIIELVNRDIPVPPAGQYRRLWALPGSAYNLMSDARLDVLLERPACSGFVGDVLVRYSTRFGRRLIDVREPQWLDSASSVCLVPRAIAWRDGAAIAVLFELQGDPLDLGRAIEVAA